MSYLFLSICLIGFGVLCFCLRFDGKEDISITVKMEYKENEKDGVEWKIKK